MRRMTMSKSRGYAAPLMIATTLAALWGASVGAQAQTAVDYTNESGGLITARGENTPNEGKAQAFDNDPNSKWLDFSNTSWIQYQFANAASRVITSYKVTSGGDAPGRDPKNWTLQGSNNGTTFVTLNSQANQSFASRNLTKTYSFTNTTAYKMVRFNITANTDGGGITQMSELRLLGPSGTSTPTPTATATPTPTPTPTATPATGDLVPEKYVSCRWSSPVK